MKTFLVTGAAGFIGAAVAKRLLDRGDRVIGIDNLNNYYSVQLKADRLQRLESYKYFQFIKGDISRIKDVNQLFNNNKRINSICHLAAQAGVRYSIDHPDKYISANLVGTANIFEAAIKFNIKHIVYASSSSVYGKSVNAPFKETNQTDRPVSLYAATKKSNELLAYSYHQVHHLKMTGLRFFTVYGPWGRPDMTPIKLSKLISKGAPIDVYNYGKMQRDFTYIDDIVDGVVLSLDKQFEYEIINLGGSEITELESFIALLGKYLGKKVKKNYLPMQPGDVLLTSANTDKAFQMLGWRAKTNLEEGVKLFIQWFNTYYHPINESNQLE